MANDNSKTENGRTLAKTIAEQGVLSAKDAAAVALQLVKAVGELHAEGKVHRQICPDTVRLDHTMSAKLDPIEPEVTIGGIGVDLVPCPPQLQNIPPVSLPAEMKAAQHVLTEAGILLDPCQIDFYQLGALLCFMVSGHSVSDYLRSCKAKADVPEVIRSIIDRALGLNAKDRLESSNSFAAELETVISGKTADRGGAAYLPESIFVEPLSEPKTESGTPRDAAAEEALPFKKLGHYQIIERIGYGGMGDVYKGYEKALDRFVAIKVLPAELVRQRDFVKRFHAEATAIAKLDHPNIVRIYYSGEDQGHHFFAMQYVDGESLADLLKRCGKLSATEALPIIEQCLAGISAAHKRGLIHRDIKPGNVLLDRHSRRALVTDFGVVKSGRTGTQITATGTIMGTADYIAPEQARGQDIDHRADLYSMGVLMYQMLSGRLPFDAKSATSMMFQHAYEPPPPLSEAAPDVPKKLAEVVMKLMAKDPTARYQSTEEVLASLQNVDLEVAPAATTPQTSVIKAPEFYHAPELPDDLIRLTGRNWLSRLRNWITYFFGTHGPQVIEYMQTTSQQVDSAVAEYQRQRDKLAELSKEAKATAAEFESQAKASRKAAQVAGEHAEAARSTTAKQQALKEKEENEQTAAELAQLAAEQAEQAEEISLRLAKLDAKLVQLRSQRDALNARMNAAKARLKADQTRPSKWHPSKRLIHTAIIFLLVCFVTALVYFSWLIVQRDDSLIAHWKFDEGSGEAAHDSYDIIRGISIYFVTIGNAGNAADTRVMRIGDNTTGYGAVGYEYCIGKYEITNAQWNAFIAVAGAPTGNPADAYDESATYPGAQQPANNISWCEALQFCNYLTSGDKSKGVYQFSGNNTNPGDFLGIDRAAARVTYGTIYFLPTEDEWYKAAYYKPDGSGYSVYSNGLNTRPVADNGWNYCGGAYNTPWNVGTGTMEQNGTFDMMGNVYEWNETLIGSFRGFRGGASNSSGDDLASWDRSGYGLPLKEYSPLGFRVASIPEALLYKQINQSQAAIYQEPSASSGLIAHWKFDEGSGNTAYDSVGKNHGIVHEATWVNGEIGKALSFDGDGDCVTVGSDVSIADIADNFTIGLWAYPLTTHEIDLESATSWRGIGGQRYAIAPVHGDGMWGGGHAGAGISIGINGISVYEHGDRHFRSLLVWEGAVSGFTHVTVVYENKQPHLYVNGVLKKRGLTSPRIVHALPGSIGGASYGYFKGKIDEVRIYNRSLSAKEIQKLYWVTASTYEKPENAGWVDILELIDVERDTRGGQWRFEDGVLVGFAQSTLETTYELPAEYDVLWEFESDSTAVNLLLASPAEKRFEWMMKGWSHRLCAIRDVGRKRANANETTTVYPLASGGRYVSELRVRNNKVVALINGEEILNYETDWSNIEVWDPWHPFELKPRTLGIWLHKHWTKTYRLKVRPHN